MISGAFLFGQMRMELFSSLSAFRCGRNMGVWQWWNGCNRKGWSKEGCRPECERTRGTRPPHAIRDGVTAIDRRPQDLFCE
jgi:hypothetical protein